MKNPSIAFALVVSSLVGCGELPDAADDESVTEETSALTLPSTFKLHNYQTDLCLGVAAGTPTPGTPLITWTCDNSANQTWSAAPKKTGDTSYYAVKNYVADNTCMHVPYDSSGTKGQIASCGSPIGGGQNPFTPIEIPGWHLVYAFTVGPTSAPKDCYRLQHQPGTLVLGVSGGNTAKGANTILWTDYNNRFTHPDQFWCVY
jgi:hypothetical protein